LANLKPEGGHSADEQNEQADHARQHRPADEEVGKRIQFGCILRRLVVGYKLIQIEAYDGSDEGIFIFQVFQQEADEGEQPRPPN
jgi:hypothetical protein